MDLPGMGLPGFPDFSDSSDGAASTPEEIAAAVRDHVRRSFVSTEWDAASVTFLGAAPLELLRGVHAEPFADVLTDSLSDSAAEPIVTYITNGCSAEPMGADAGTGMVRSTEGPRAEIVVSLRGGVDAVVRPLAILAVAPVIEGLVLVEDALVDLGQPLWEGSAFTAWSLTLSGVPDLALPGVSDPVRFFRAIPVTHTEAAWQRLKGAAALREAWHEAGIDITDPFRSAASL